MDPAAQKKMLLERRKHIMEQSGRTSTNAALSSGLQTQSQQQPPTPAPSTSSTQQPPNTLFSNDGSFLERFKAMQNQNKSLVGDSNASGKISMKVSASTNQKSNLLNSRGASGFEDSGSRESTVGLQSSLSLSKPVADRHGNDIDAMVKRQSQDQPTHSALTNTRDSMQSLAQDNPSQPKDRSQRKKRRWDSDKDETGTTAASTSTPVEPSPADIMAEFEKAKAIAQAKAKQLKTSTYGHTPTPSVGVAPMSNKEQGVYNQLVNMCESGTDKISHYNANQQAAIQQEIHAMFKRIIAEQKIKEVVTNATQSSKPKYEYDSDEDIDGGTWEHKKRKKEMEKTKEMAQQLTQANRGKHFIGDFLPLKELQKFLEKVRAIKEGRDPDLSDYSEHKLTDDNLGYRMLQQAGWKEGQGLGSEGSGITAPINQGAGAFQNAGLGIEKPHEVEKEDDEFELYRKRMMLAYRFRPNPMNNPRRPYY